MNTSYDPFDYDPDDGLGSELLDHLEYQNHTDGGFSALNVESETAPGVQQSAERCPR